MVSRKRREWLIQIGSFLVMTLSFYVTAYRCQIAGPREVQCATAPVQKIIVPVWDSHGEVIGYEERAPRKGDEAYLQCRCEEKTAPVVTLKTTSGDSLLMVLPAEWTVEPTRLMVPWETQRLVESCLTCAIPPPVRPPPVS